MILIVGIFANIIIVYENDMKLDLDMNVYEVWE